MLKTNPHYESIEKQQKRLRVFAGPNGSGKSTVIETVRNIRINGRPVDFGYYINSDDLSKELDFKAIDFNRFGLKIKPRQFLTIALRSGLINADFTEKEFVSSYSLRNNLIRLKIPKHKERLAQILADFLRKMYLEEKKKFSFETVFSHPSKLDVMREAQALGYKVYLYFVSTSSPTINKFRVEARKAKGGHDVPPDKIDARYFRSLDLLFDACQLAYQAFFFDNSAEGEESVLFAHFKLEKGRKVWDQIDPQKVPYWFRKYYSNKLSRNLDAIEEKRTKKYDSREK